MNIQQHLLLNLMEVVDQLLSSVATAESPAKSSRPLPPLHCSPRAWMSLPSVMPTPTVALATEKLGATGGISFTASHNPMQWNRMKFFAPTGLFLDAEQNQEFWTIALNNEAKFAEWQKIGKHTADDSWLRKHIDMILSHKYVDLETIRKKKFKVVVDAVNAAQLGAGKTALKSWLQNANAVYMGYMLSAQLAALKLNVLHGVSGSALVYAPGCGNTGVDNNFIMIAAPVFTVYVGFQGVCICCYDGNECSIVSRSRAA
jgi:hypothetical protein